MATLYSKDYVVVKLLENRKVQISEDCTDTYIFLEERDLHGVIDALKNAVANLEKATEHKKALAKTESGRLVF